MASSNFDGEIKAAMKGEPGDTPAEIARDKKAGIKQGSAADKKEDAAREAKRTPRQIEHAMPPTVAGMPPDPHHAALAASIAHAILGRR